jgi:hypothetical protein
MPIGLGTAIAIGAGTAAVGAVASGVIQSKAISSAANTSAAASRDATAQQARQFDAATAEQSRQFDASQAAIREGTANANVAQREAFANSNTLNQPSLVTGNSALTRLAQLYGVDTVGADGATSPGNPGAGVDPNATFYQSPDYQFALSQGVKGVDAGASARHMLDSGATRKAEIKYAGNLASGQFGSYAQRLASLAGIGQDAVTRGIDNNRNFATLYGNAQLGQGTNLANTGTTYGNNFAAAATNYGNNYATTVQNAANNQANAALAGGANISNTINGVAGAANSFLTNPALRSSYAPAGQSSGAEFGWT